MLTTLPTLTLDEVYHVGTLNCADRQKWSYEGDGLSVSIHPDEWAQIAKLPGSTWVLCKPEFEPLVFVSWHDVTEADRRAIRAWAEEQGWVTQRTVYRVSWFDSDYDEQVSMDFNDRSEAEVDAESRAGMDPNISPTLAWRATETFPMERVASDCDPTDLLLAVYVRENLPEVDGVWWEDNFDPYALSCPRGVLVRDLATYIQRQC